MKGDMKYRGQGSNPSLKQACLAEWGVSDIGMGHCQEHVMIIGTSKEMEREGRWEKGEEMEIKEYQRKRYARWDEEIE